MTRTFKILIAVVLVLFFAFALSGNTQASVEPQIVRVTLTDYKVELSQFTVTPGRVVQFAIDNQSSRVHHFVVLPYVETSVNPADVTVIAPGTLRTIQRTLAPGIYRVECNEWDHAERGMLNVIAAEAPRPRAFPIRMDFIIPLVALILGSGYIIGDALGLRLTRPTAMKRENGMREA